MEFTEPPPFTVEAQGHTLTFYPAGRDRLMRLEGLAAASESLLDDFEQLAEQYEHSMQMLMG